MLKLIGEFETAVCRECGGRGSVPCPPTLAVRSGINGNNAKGAINVPGTGRPIPCPTCKGKKVVTCPPSQSPTSSAAC